MVGLKVGRDLRRLIQIGARGTAEAAFEVVAEVPGLGVAELGGDGFHGFTFGQQFRAPVQAGAVEPFAGWAAEVAAGEVFEVAEGEAQQLGRRGGIIAGAMGQLPPMFFGGVRGALCNLPGHSASRSGVTEWHPDSLQAKQTHRNRDTGDNSRSAGGCLVWSLELGVWSWEFNR